MFNRELKEEILELKKRVWILEHPFKFQIGDRVKVSGTGLVNFDKGAFKIIASRLNVLFREKQYDVINIDDCRISVGIPENRIEKVKK